MAAANELLQAGDLLLLLLDLLLLFLDGVDQNGSDAVGLHAFDFTFVVAGDEQRLNRGDVFGTEAEVMHAALFPIERDRTQTIEHLEPADKWLNVGLVTQTG